MAPRLTPRELVAPAHEWAVAEWMVEATTAEIVELAAFARASFRAWPWTPQPRLDRPIPPLKLAPAMAALLSVHRSGYVRELALENLIASRDPIAVPFLVLRVDDIVPSLRAHAEDAVLERLDEERASAFVRSLGIVDLLRTRLRGGASELGTRIDAFLIASPSLDAGFVSADRLVRLASYKLGVRRGAPATVLARALGDSDVRVRFWAARTAISKATSLSEKKALLPLLEVSRSPWTRSLALRARAHLETSDGFLEAATLDHDARVRWVARTLLRTRHPGHTTREAALLVLASETAAERLVGALGALSDVGLRADLEAVAPFLEDPRARVRSEARRTNDILGR